MKKETGKSAGAMCRSRRSHPEGGQKDDSLASADDDGNFAGPRRSRWVPLLVLVSALVVATILVWSASVAAQPTGAARSKQAETCTRVKDLAQSPGWTISSSWSLDGRKLFVVDSRYNQVLQYSETGRFLGPLPEAIGGQLGNFFPSVMKSHGSNHLVEFANGRFVTLDSGLRPIAKRNVLAEGVRDGVKIASMFQWEPAGREVVTYSDLQGPGASEWRTAFLRVPLDNPSAFRVLQPLPQPTPMRTLMRLGQPYIASVGTTVFVLMAEGTGTMRLYKNEQGKTDLEPLRDFFPTDSNLAPILPRFTEPSDFVEVMQTVEKSTMPTGLYGWENALYVVSRSPDAAGTRWYLTRIDPRTDEVTGSAEIPTRAKHLLVSPGPRQWGFIEKASVKALGVQNIEGFLFVPAEKIRESLRGTLCN